jgi:hypothetical protein
VAPKLFALDHNFPQPIAAVLGEYQDDATLVPIADIDARLVADTDDWEILLALHHHKDPFDGLITTDASMLNRARELAVLCQTKLTLVVADEAGHDPVKATGLVFAFLGGICHRTDPDTAQIWLLRAKSKKADDPWDHIKRVADHQNRDTQAVWEEAQLSEDELARNPLD